jgi:ATP-dependent RNA helicase HelY
VPADFRSLFPFELDSFQERAIAVLASGHSVLVSAPTGIGKTVVGYYCAYSALNAGGICIYTTPLKALSNQKLEELRALFGTDKVGLATGDRSENQEAPIVVMTTEILRNMIHAEDERLKDLSHVVLDEIHYIQDPYRGGVWEEIILQAPERTQFACLSATASNAQELAGWITKVHGTCEAIEVHERPVPLKVLFASENPRTKAVELTPVLTPKNTLHPRIASAYAPRKGGRRGHPFLRLRPPSTVSMIRHLKDRGMLPAIYFVFSRAGCERLAVMARLAGLSLTTPEEREEIQAIFSAAVEGLTQAELAALDYHDFLAGALAGIAPHHAGLVPAFKVAVERAFNKGLIKVVFATETLSTGINMPAKTVVVERPTKYAEEGHRMLTRAEFAQLSGRAGRRGIDEEGYSILLASPLLSKGDLLSYARAKEFVVRSAFRPTYNMAVNLVQRLEREEVYALLDRSLAAHQARRSLVGDFKRVAAVLERTGCLDGWSVTEKGQLLRRIYHEADLLIVNCIWAGILEDLDPTELAAALAGLCAEDKQRGRRGSRRFKDDLARAILQQARELNRIEHSFGVPPTKAPVFDYEEPVVLWAEGADLDEVLSVTDLSGGDFVRLIRQVLDLLSQFREVGVLSREVIDQATAALERGIVAAF